MAHFAPSVAADLFLRECYSSLQNVRPAAKEFATTDTAVIPPTPAPTADFGWMMRGSSSIPLTSGLDPSLAPASGRSIADCLWRDVQFYKAHGPKIRHPACGTWPKL